MRRSVDGQEVELSSLDKPLFPDGTTKGDLITYYERIADRLLPHLRGRPLTLYRCPGGIAAGGFYQKAIPEYLPDWIDRVTVRKREGGSQTLVVADSPATLVWLANQAAVALHPWASRGERLEHPDRLTIDLDPPDSDFGVVRHAARACRALLEELDLPCWPKTTGSRGLHVVVALDGRDDFDSVRDFAKRAMALLADRHPDRLTVEMRKSKRKGRLYLDVARNAYAQTAVAPYSVRPLPGAPVSMPLAWEELSRSDVHARTWTIRNVFRRLGQREDPWSGLARHRASISKAAGKLRALRRQWDLEAD